MLNLEPFPVATAAKLLGNFCARERKRTTRRDRGDVGEGDAAALLGVSLQHFILFWFYFKQPSAHFGEETLGTRVIFFYFQI